MRTAACLWKMARWSIVLGSPFLILGSLVWGIDPTHPQKLPAKPSQAAAQTPPGDSDATNKMRSVTPEMRKAAAARAAAARASAARANQQSKPAVATGRASKSSKSSKALTQITPQAKQVFALAAAAPVPGGTPNYFGPEPNYANSPMPTGTVTAVTLANGGSGYTAPTVTITDAYGTGTGATATATVVGGVITAITLGSAGTGYTAPGVTITDTTGTGAVAVATINGSVLSGGLRKFVDTLPGVGFANKNNLGQYIPVAQKIPNSFFPNDDYYEIGLLDYNQQMHSDLPATGTKLRGYKDLAPNAENGGTQQYLGPLIIAKSGTPVRIKFTNMLGNGALGNLFLPVDTTAMGAGTGPLDMANGNMELYTQNRAVLHLHGGVTPWISDGTPHQWITPVNEQTSYKTGVSLQNVPDMYYDATGKPTAPTPATAANPGPGSATYFYSNQQSGRLMFYHDHSYGMTRLNVYAGEAAGYLLWDQVEEDLISGTNVSGVNPTSAKVIPDLTGNYHFGIPLVIQDKTFVDATTIAAQDPTWNWGSTPGTPNTGDLWFPHVYMPNQNPADPMGVNGVGRWDYGCWFWPPIDPASLAHGPITDPVTGVQTPGTPNPSMVMEGYMDTPIVNGTAYPKMAVAPQAYRFRILNACNDRYLNLQLYYVDPANPTEIKTLPAVPHSKTTPAPSDGMLLDPGTAALDPVSGLPAGYWPATWPTDGRDGGVPDPRTAGPAMVEIGTEGGFLSSPVVIPSTPVGYEYNRRSITVLNVGTHGLLLGPAERADVIVDFSKVPAGSQIILYNDAPAPNPGFDPRNDYWTGDGDLSASGDPATGGQTGGAPPTKPGYGPNTRTIMRFEVTLPATGAPAFDLAALKAAWPAAYAAAQPPAIVPAGVYSHIQDTSLTFPLNGNALAGVKLTAAGTGYSQPPTVSFTGSTGTGATATATIASIVKSITLTSGGSGYTLGATVSITGGGGSGAAATATTTGMVNSVTITNNGRNYSSAPTVVFTGGGGTGAAATVTVANGRITGVTITNRGSGYTSAPTVSFTGGGGSRATATATVTVGVNAITLTNPGAGYTSTPTVTIVGEGTGAAATANMTGVVTGITLTNGGTGYTTVPTVVFAGGGGGTGAAATASITTSVAMQPKAIQELFELNYGRMNATLGTELPFTNFNTQTTIPLGYIDPPTETMKNGETQLWKITHNGVDTHSIHFHLFNVQLVNRVGWDGTIKPPDPNEVGWKETVRMNPLEDAIVALKPIAPTLPFKLPDSIRPLDPTMPIGSTMGFSAVDPFTGNPATITNVMTNFGWEYVWHCHILGHEEMDMMRPVVFKVSPAIPTGLTAQASAPGVSPLSVTLKWVNPAPNPASTTFTVLRATDALFTKGLTTMTVLTGTSLTDTTVADGTQYYYVVRAENAISYSDWTSSVTATTPMAAPTALSVTLAAQTPLAANLAWTNNSSAATSFLVQRATNATFTTGLATYTVTNATTYSNSPISANTTYYYRVQATNATGTSLWSNVVSITASTPPTPTSMTATPSAASVNPPTVTLGWVENTTVPLGGFTIQRATNSGFTQNLQTFTVAGTARSYVDNAPPLSRNTRYYYRMRAFNAVGTSGWVGAQANTPR